MHNPCISVIIPVYNAEKYLQRCLDSVCNQTLKNIEIICVDDCSTDNSAQIIRDYAARFTYIKFLPLATNQGESAARNAGLHMAKGDYLAFVDNDDELDLNFYETLYQKAKQKDADIVKGQVMEIGYNGKKHIIKQVAERKDNKLLFLTYWWSAIFKRCVIAAHNISFCEEYPLGGDLLFLNQAVIAAQSFDTVNDVYYYYYRREDSGDSKVLSEVKIKSALSIYDKVIDNINANVACSYPAYHFIFHHFLMACFYLALRNEEAEVRKICATMTMHIFEKCQDKEGLQKYFSSTSPYLFEMLKNKDKSGIERTLINCESRLQLIMSGLRSRIKNK